MAGWAIGTIVAAAANKAAQSLTEGLGMEDSSAGFTSGDMVFYCHQPSPCCSASLHASHHFIP
jgi:hypothetical protein